MKYKEFVEEDNRMIPSIYRGILSDTLENKIIKKEIDKYVNSFKKMHEKGWGYYFWGNIGSGKTYAMMVLYNEIVRNY
jgi:predicted ATPase